MGATGDHSRRRVTEAEYDEIDHWLFRLFWEAASDIERECWREIRNAFNAEYPQFSGDPLGRIDDL